MQNPKCREDEAMGGTRGEKEVHGGEKRKESKG
jgi:hypothetical protein